MAINGLSALQEENKDTTQATPPAVAPVAPVQTQKDPLTGLDSAINRLEQTVSGVDPMTESLLNKQNQTSAASDAARKASERQQAAQSGVSGLRASGLSAMSQISADTAKQGAVANIALGAIDRATNAASNLASLTVQKSTIEKSDFEKSVSSVDIATLSPEEYSKLEADGKRLYGNTYSLSGKKVEIERKNFNDNLATIDPTTMTEADIKMLEEEGKRLNGPTFSLTATINKAKREQFTNNLTSVNVGSLSKEDYGKLEAEGKKLYGDSWTLSGAKFDSDKENFNTNLKNIDFTTMTTEQIAALEAEGKRLNGPLFSVQKEITKVEKDRFDANLANVTLANLTDAEITALEIAGAKFYGDSYDLSAVVKEAKITRFDKDLATFTDWGNQAAVDALTAEGKALRGDDFSVKDKVQTFWKSELDTFATQMKDTDMDDFSKVWSDYTDMYKKAYPDRALPDRATMENQIYGAKEVATQGILSTKLANSVHVTSGTPLLTATGDLNTADPQLRAALVDHYKNMSRGDSMFVDTNGNNKWDEGEILSYGAKSWLTNLDSVNSTQGKVNAKKNTYLTSTGFVPGSKEYIAASNGFDDASTLANTGYTVVRINGKAVGWVNSLTGAQVNLTDDTKLKFGITTSGMGYQTTTNPDTGARELVTGSGEVFKVNSANKLVTVIGGKEVEYKGTDATEILGYVSGGTVETTEAKKIEPGVVNKDGTVTITSRDGTTTVMTEKNSVGLYETNKGDIDVFRNILTWGGNTASDFVTKYGSKEFIDMAEKSSAGSFATGTYNLKSGKYQHISGKGVSGNSFTKDAIGMKVSLKGGTAPLYVMKVEGGVAYAINPATKAITRLSLSSQGGNPGVLSGQAAGELK